MLGEEHWLGQLMNEGADAGLSLLGTYFMHGLAWAFAAGLLCRARSLSSATKNLVWKVALLAPFVSASLAGHGMGLHLAALSAPLPVPRGDGVLAWRSREALPRAHWFAWATFVAASLGGLRFLVAWVSLWERVRARVRVGDGRLLARLEHVAQAFGLGRVVLSESARVESPLVVGPREICIPKGALAELTDAELDAVFAHELAHAERRDWLWFPLAGFIEAVLWFQPLNHWVAARLRRSAELACDDRAVELTRAPRALAAALARIAIAGVRPSLAPAMGSAAHTVMLRVRRLSGDGEQTRTGKHARLLAVAALLVVFATLLGFEVKATSPAATSPAATSPAATSPAATSPAAATRSVDVLSLNQELAALLHREAEVEVALRAAESVALAPETAPRVLELRQELSHVRAAERWAEERFAQGR